jgi:hypothetical protein
MKEKKNRTVSLQKGKGKKEERRDEPQRTCIGMTPMETMERPRMALSVPDLAAKRLRRRWET